jgi:hypothetical protein
VIIIHDIRLYTWTTGSDLIELVQWNKDEVLQVRSLRPRVLPGTPAGRLPKYARMFSGLDNGKSLLLAEGKKPPTIRAAHPFGQTGTQNILPGINTTHIAAQIEIEVTHYRDFLA